MFILRHYIPGAITLKFEMRTQLACDLIITNSCICCFAFLQLRLNWVGKEADLKGDWILNLANH